MGELPQPAAADIRITEVMRALADPARLAAVARVAESDGLTCEATGSGLGVHKSTMSHHYRVLREAGIITMRTQGRERFISLRRADLDARFPGLLDSVVAGARDEAQASAG